MVEEVPDDALAAQEWKECTLIEFRSDEYRADVFSSTLQVLQAVMSSGIRGTWGHESSEKSQRSFLQTFEANPLTLSSEHCV